MKVGATLLNMRRLCAHRRTRKSCTGLACSNAVHMSFAVHVRCVTSSERLMMVMLCTFLGITVEKEAHVSAENHVAEAEFEIRVRIRKCVLMLRAVPEIRVSVQK